MPCLKRTKMWNNFRDNQNKKENLCNTCYDIPLPVMLRNGENMNTGIEQKRDINQR